MASRESFEFDGGTVKFTTPGLIVATVLQMMFWTAIAVFILSVLALLGLALGASFMHFKFGGLL